MGGHCCKDRYKYKEMGTCIAVFWNEPLWSLFLKWDNQNPSCWIFFSVESWIWPPVLYCFLFPSDPLLTESCALCCFPLSSWVLSHLSWGRRMPLLSSGTHCPSHLLSSCSLTLPLSALNGKSSFVYCDSELSSLCLELAFRLLPSVLRVNSLLKHWKSAV